MFLIATAAAVAAAFGFLFYTRGQQIHRNNILIRQIETRFYTNCHVRNQQLRRVLVTLRDQLQPALPLTREEAADRLGVYNHLIATIHINDCHATTPTGGNT